MGFVEADGFLATPPFLWKVVMPDMATSTVRIVLAYRFSWGSDEVGCLWVNSVNKFRYLLILMVDFNDDHEFIHWGFSS